MHSSMVQIQVVNLSSQLMNAQHGPLDDREQKSRNDKALRTSAMLLLFAFRLNYFAFCPVAPLGRGVFLWPLKLRFSFFKTSDIQFSS